MSISTGQRDNGDSSPPLICSCYRPPIPFKIPGVGVSYWEPARVAEVVREPMCSPTLGGASLGGSNNSESSGGQGGANNSGGSGSGGTGGGSSGASNNGSGSGGGKLIAPRGTNKTSAGTENNAFYHVHWIQFPVLNWLGMVLGSGCGKSETFDMAYMSELDALWEDDEASFVLNPEAVLFANPVSQLACVADSLKALTTSYGIDALFWCSGSHGSVFPLTGHTSGHLGGLETTLALSHRMIFKLHREGLGMDTSTPAAICYNLPQPVLRKNQYKQHILYPIPLTQKAFGFGVSTALWGMGREFPYRGEDFTYMIWRKIRCCEL